MATTYEAIATVTVGSGGAADITFSSIPATYTDLLVKLSLKSTATGRDRYIRVDFNSSSANFNYKALRAITTGTIQGVEDTGNFISFYSASDMEGFGSAELYIPNYAGSNYKQMSVDGTQERNGDNMWMNLVASLWSNTSAISSIKFYPDVNDFAQYSTATLYGIKNS